MRRCRLEFRDAMEKVGLVCARSQLAYSMAEARAAVDEIGLPCVIRPGFTMGGSGIAYNLQEFEEICARGLAMSLNSEILIEESIAGWKEFELEVIRDKNDNVIIVCSIENFDPMGVHTGVPRTTFAKWLTTGVLLRTATRGVYRTTATTLDRVRRAYARSR